MFEKSGQTLYAQRQMIECRKTGNRPVALWWMRVAKSYRQRDMRDAQLSEDECPEGVWWQPRAARYVNG